MLMYHVVIRFNTKHMYFIINNFLLSLKWCLNCMHTVTHISVGETFVIMPKNTAIF